MTVLIARFSSIWMSVPWLQIVDLQIPQFHARSSKQAVSRKQSSCECGMAPMGFRTSPFVRRSVVGCLYYSWRWSETRCRCKWLLGMAFRTCLIWFQSFQSTCLVEQTTTLRPHTENVPMRTESARSWAYTFTPLVMALTGGLGKAASICYKRFASLLASKRHQPYSSTIAWLRCRLCFCLLRSLIQCIQGAHSACGRASNMSVPQLDLVVSEASISG